MKTLKTPTIEDQLADAVASKVVDKLIEEGLVADRANVPEEVVGIPKLYTREEVSELARVSLPTLDRHRKMGLISESYYVGQSPRFTEEDIKKYISKFEDGE